MRQISNTMKTTLRMSLPAMIESFFMCFTGLVDSLMVSTLGPAAVASIGLTTQPKFIGLAVHCTVGAGCKKTGRRRKGQG